MSVPYAFTAVTSATGAQLDADFAACAQLDVLAATAGAPLVGFKQAGAATVLSDVQTKLRQVVSVFDFFTPSQIADVIAGTLTLDMTSPLANANASGLGLLFPTGQYKISGSPTFTVPCTFQYGAILNVATAQTVTFNKGLYAGVYQTFALTGTAAVVVNPAFTSIGFPEWWGAITNTGGADDCLAAINACIVACRITKLQAADYWVSGTVLLQTNNRSLEGSGWYFSFAGSATRILLNHGSLTILKVGPNTYPAGGFNYFQLEAKVQYIELWRATNPINASLCIGLDATYTLGMRINNVKVRENEVGYHYLACVDCHTDLCFNFRSILGTGGGTGTARSYWIDGTSDTGNIHGNASGGNASIYFNQCNGSINNTITASIITYGFYIDGNFADTYLVSCEADQCTYGLALLGNALTSQNYGNTDVQITNFIADGFFGAGYLIQNTSKYGSIQIDGGMASPWAAGSPLAGIYFNSSNAQVMVRGVQMACNNNASCYGIVAANSSNIESECEIIDCHVDSINLTSVTNSRFLDHLTNYSASCNTALKMVSGCTRNYCQVFFTGKATASAIGYNLAGITNQYNEMNCTGIEAAAIVGGPGNKLVQNGTQVTLVGVFATDNYASGIMA
jgi:hypothetical protein